jgi:hypothetical protein
MRKSTRNTIRTISLLVIAGTIPLYILGIGFWLFSPAGNRPGSEPTSINEDNGDGDNTPGFATFTPLGQNDTREPVSTITPIGLPTQGGFPTFNPGQFPTVMLNSPTPPPTRFITATFTIAPTATTPPPVVPTNQPPVVPTNPPPVVPTQPILLPPTDTPSP